MVRLLLFCSQAILMLMLSFQSHNGAIAAQHHDTMIVKAVLFQSHNGAIAAIDPTNYPAFHNSFQSHNGAIAARTEKGIEP